MYTLTSQLRCKGGLQYLNDIRELLDGRLSHPVFHTDYEIGIVDDFQTFDTLCAQKEADHGLNRMAAGYAWEWKSKTDPTAVDIEIDGVKKKWNSCLENWVHSEHAREEIGCIHTTQGYDLN